MKEMMIEWIKNDEWGKEWMEEEENERNDEWTNEGKIGGMNEGRKWGDKWMEEMERKGINEKWRKWWMNERRKQWEN